MSFEAMLKASIGPLLLIGIPTLTVFGLGIWKTTELINQLIKKMKGKK